MCYVLSTFLLNCESLSWLLVPGCLQPHPRASAALSPPGKHPSWGPGTKPGVTLVVPQAHGFPVAFACSGVSPDSLL